MNDSISALDQLEDVTRRTETARAWLRGDFAQAWRSRVDAEGPSVELKLAAHNRRDVFVVREVFEPAFRVLEIMSRGRLSVKAIWGEASHTLTQGWAVLRQGRVDITPCYPSHSPELGFKRFDALSLPAVFSGAHVATLVSELLYRQHFKSEFDAQGVRMARLKSTGSDVIFSTREIRCADDMKGLRLCASEGWHGEIYREMGATIIMKTPPQVAQAIASGELDAVAMTDGSAQVFGVHRVASCRLDTGLGRLNLPYCVAPATYDALPADLRDVLDAWFSGLAQAEAQVFYGVGGAQARVHFEGEGMVATRLDAGDRATLLSASQSLRDRYAREMDAEELDGSQLIRSLVELANRHSGASEGELMTRAIEQPVAGISKP